MRTKMLVFLAILTVILPQCRWGDLNGRFLMEGEGIAYEIEEPSESGTYYYVDPVNGNDSNDGSFEHPWRNLQNVMDNRVDTYFYRQGSLVSRNPAGPVSGGDVIVLRDGNHGKMTVLGGYNAEYITVKAQPGHTPVLSGISLTAVSRWNLKGLSVTPQNGERLPLVNILSHASAGATSNVVVDGCKIYSVEDSSGWTQADWNNFSCNGISSSGTSIIVRNNQLTNIWNGITLSDNIGRVQNNTVKNFSGDGMRGNGNDLVFEYNLVKNSYQVDNNHLDGFQSFAIRDMPPRERVVLRGNTFLDYEDIDQPFRGDLQGIGCFDGPYIDWVIENNIVIVNTYHGISLYGAYNCRIVNNTVIDPLFGGAGPATIRIVDHKDGTPSQNCLIRNNIATNIATGRTGVSQDHNFIVGYNAADYNNIFRDFVLYDLRLNPGTPVINTGTGDLAPLYDIELTQRPSGGAIDLGAYEL